MTPQERAANYMRLKDGYKNKEEQKQHLIDMMQDDEKLGLYDETKLTAMQMLFVELEQKHPELFNVYTNKGKSFINDFHKYIEMEKQQIRKAYLVDVYNSQYGFEQYYNETYDKSR